MLFQGDLSTKKTDMIEVRKLATAYTYLTNTAADTKNFLGNGGTTLGENGEVLEYDKIVNEGAKKKYIRNGKVIKSIDPFGSVSIYDGDVIRNYL